MWRDGGTGQESIFGGHGLLRTRVVALPGGRGRQGGRARASGDGGGYQVMLWSNAKAGADWSSGSAEGSSSAPVASHSGAVPGQRSVQLVGQFLRVLDERIHDRLSILLIDLREHHVA